MLRRFLVSQGGKPAITVVQSNTLTSSTTNTAHYSIVIVGPKSCVVGFKVTIYSSVGTGPEMSINSTDYILNDTFNVTLDSVTGMAPLIQFLKIDTPIPPNLISVQITIVSVSKGTISNSFFEWSNSVGI